MHKSVDKNVEIGLRCHCYQVYIEWRLYEKDKLFFNRKCFKIKIVKLYETIGIKNGFNEFVCISVKVRGHSNST
jgi:hypothetical protein